MGNVTLFLAGDVMTGRGIDQILPCPGDPALRESYVRDARVYVELAEAAHGPIPRPVAPAYIWGDALEVFRHTPIDVGIVNLETSVTCSNDRWPDKPVLYRMHPGNTTCLRAAPIDVCTLANNHVLDFGYAGLQESLSVLAAAGLKTVGAGRDLTEAQRPAIAEVPGGCRIVVFGLGSPTSGVPPEWQATDTRAGIDFLDRTNATTAAAACERVRRSKRPGDLVVMSIHWGSNWDYAVPPTQVEFAHELIDSGVDVVHGHSSHHPRPPEVYRGKLVLHGCGDLIDDYEGIGGHEEFRPDLRLMYFARLNPCDGGLLGLDMVPVQVRGMRLTRATPADSAWLQSMLNHIAAPFGARVHAEADGVLTLERSWIHA
jgi:poly-gamma-glutamate capsule biosynthesis protein CapA/YwtB (metallophosphatase superfamily)